MKDFNVVVSGIGGQGVLTIAAIIAEAALKQGYDVKRSELHGLAMRFGHLESHIRFGKKIYSSIVEEANADLIIGLERLEALRTLYYANKKTTILFDTKAAVPVHLHLQNIRYPNEDETARKLRAITKKVFRIDASRISKQLTGKTVFSNIYLLGCAFAKGKLPLKKENIIYGIKQIVPPKTFETNKKVFEAAIT